MDYSYILFISFIWLTRHFELSTKLDKIITWSFQSIIINDIVQL